MKKTVLILFLSLFFLPVTFAAYFENVPQIRVQPNGDTLHCFASGDEYFHRLHDEDNYTIVLDPATGYYVYADKMGDELVPTSYVAGRTNPAEVGLIPGLSISSEQWRARRQRWEMPTRLRGVRAGQPNHGHINNIVIFIRFADDTEFTSSLSEVNSMFNDSTPGYSSMYNYFKSATYNKLYITSTFYPTQSGSTIVSYQDTYNRKYFEPYSSSNTQGYSNEDARTSREHALLARAVNAVASQIPSSINIDYNNDGYVDNVVFVVRGNVGGWSDLLWPHRWSLYSENAYINGKRVWDFNLQLADATSYFNTSVLCHEMNHSLGAPDLYHYYEGTNMEAVSSWDLMHQNTNPPQHMGAYMKFKYGHWIDSIPEITECGTYSLYSVGSSATNNCYKIASPNPNEFFVLEYRNTSDLFEGTLPSSGLLVYRINTDFEGNANYDGSTIFDEVYIYRPNGTTTENGNINRAAFGSNFGRTRMNETTNPKPFLTDGTIVGSGNFSISDVSTAGEESITFTFCRIPITVTTSSASNITHSTATAGGTVTASSGTTVTTRGVCWSTSLNPTIADSHTTDGSGSGSFTSNITGLTQNTTYYLRAYATNSEGTVYGNTVSFTTPINPNGDEFSCPGTPILTDIDGNLYSTVQIGGQCWMRENLRTTQYADGTAIPHGSSTSTSTAYWYYPNNSSANESMYGLLYNWHAVMRDATSSDATPSGVQGVCPDGWHVPSSAEWKQLTDYVSSQSQYWCGDENTNIAKALASPIGWESSSDLCAVGKNSSDNNRTGFGAVPAGRLTAYDSYSGFGYYTVFWASTELSSTVANYQYLQYDIANSCTSYRTKYSAQSVRCIRDEDHAQYFPTVTTRNISNITSSSATCGGNISTPTGVTVTARGVCWSITPYPTVDGSHTNNGSGTGSFTSNLTGLSSNYTYYVRAYATTLYGTVYGEEKTFTTPVLSNGDAHSCSGTPTLTDIDGNVYNTVRVGSQCWMRENLRTTKYANGSSIPQYQWRYPDRNNSSYKQTFGLLYYWDAVMHNESSSDNIPSGVQGICPDGWHVPSNAEWTLLTNYVSSQNEYLCSDENTNIAKALSSTTGWISSSSNCAVGNSSFDNNATGFSLVPAGEYSWVALPGPNDYFGIESFLWTSTESNGESAYYRYLYYSGTSIYHSSDEKDELFSVRCLKDEDLSQYYPTVTTNNAANITATTATCSGNVSYNGDATVTARGICWSTHNNPTIEDNHTSNGSGTGSFTTNLTGFASNLTYYVRAYATNSYGTFYGNEVSFTTTINPNGDAHSCPSSPTLTDIDGNMYNTVQIGIQCWMRENLRTTKYADGTAINQGDSKWYYSNGKSSYKQTYGLLYNWYATMRGESSSDAVPSGIQGVCPDGWHIPSISEWTQLADYVSSQTEYLCNNDNTNIAKALSGTIAWANYTAECSVGNNLTENNATYFGAMPAGMYLSNYASHYQNFGSSASFASATEYTGNYESYFKLSYYSGEYYLDYHLKASGYSVRCVKDEYETASLPTVITNTPTNTTLTSATCGGNVTNSGGVGIITRGVCWSTHHNPTTNDNYTSDGASTGDFTSMLTGLTPNTTYYVRAYAENSVGTAYGNEVSFTATVNPNGDEFSCPGTPTLSDSDGNTYNTVQIGGQCWMRENLRTTQYADGTPIAQGNNTSNTTPYWYYPDNDTENKQSYGLLYNWNAVMNGSLSDNSTLRGVQGICPDGWHVPSDAEWDILTYYVSRQSEYWCNGDSSYIAKALASPMGWNNYSYTCTPGYHPNDNNATGFSALPAGYFTGTYYRLGRYAYFWSSTESRSSYGWYRYLSYSSYSLYRSNSYQYYGNSVRCLRDETSSQYFPTVTTHNVSNIAANSATCGGSITVSNGVGVTARGVCWSTSPYPTLSDNHTTDGNSIGNFSSNLTGLVQNTTYYVRAYATNQYGTVYGNDVVFTTPINPNGDEHSCPGVPTLTDRDGNLYSTVQIGGQCWMRENLRTTQYADGTPIAQGNERSNTTPYWYFPNNDATNKQTYGLLYNWPATMHEATTSDATPSGVQGICPNGWHVPSDAEWDILTDYVSSQSDYWCGGDSNYIAKALASPMGWDSYSSYCTPGYHPNDNNATGFSALPAGNFFYTYYGLGRYAYFWSSTESNSTYGWYRYLNYSNSILYRSNSYQDYGYSVRCLRDETSSQYFPTVTTHNVTNIAATTATCGGSITVSNGVGVTARGVCWSSSPHPTLSDNHTTDGNSIGNFSSTLTGLVQNTLYYVRAYATNQYGTVYGNDVVFTTPINPNGDEYSCPGVPTLTDRDGNLYSTVQIGGQCWMRENLRTTQYADGTPIAQGSNTSNTTPYWYYPNNDIANKQTYGLLYNWPATMHEATTSDATPSGVQGICPNGWHVPSDAEWTILIDYVSSQSEYGCSDNSSYIAKALASPMGWHSYSSSCTPGDNPNDNNATGFNALPVGYFYSTYYNLGYSAYFWSSTENSSSYGWYRYLHYSNSILYRSNSYQDYGYSVRCLRDETSSQYFPTVTTHNVTNIAATTATCGGSITVSNGVGVTARGVCWSSSPHPTLSDNHTTDGNSIGNFSSTLTGLVQSTLYYVRAYATNQYGTVYGNDVVFTTSINPNGDEYSCPVVPTLTDRDGNLYSTVQIGGQCWMRENLRTTKYADGTPITQGSGTSNTTPHWYYPNNSPIYKQAYGLLYNWPATMHEATTSDSTPSGVQGICPDGWHIPSDAEWTILTDYVSSQSDYWCNGSSNYIAKALASPNGWDSYYSYCSPSYIPNDNNATGFSALPAGYFSGTYYDLGINACFWSSTEKSSSSAWYRYLNYRSYSLYRSNSYQYYGYSVRCLHDENASGYIRPNVITNEISNLLTTSATGGGYVVNDGGANVTARGVCWSTSHNPTLNDNHTLDGSGTGAFTSNITGLTPNTTYYVRAYATNSVGTAYGEEVITMATLPVITTGTVTQMSNSTASCDGNVISEGGTVTARGVCWSTSPNPTIADNHTIDGSGLGNFTSTLTGLTHNSTYFVRAYATNSIGTSYGEEVTLHIYLVIPQSGTETYRMISDTVIVYDHAGATLNYNNNCNGTLVLSAPTENMVLFISGNYNTERNYDYLYLYEGNGTENPHTTLTGSGDIVSSILIPQNTATLKFTSDGSSVQSGLELTVTAVPATALPIVTTQPITNVTSRTATCGGTVSSTSDVNVTARGVCWSINHNPTIVDAHTTDGNGIGGFTSSITELFSNFTYYVRAYATNQYGTVYGEEVSFSTPINPNGDERSCPGIPTLTDQDGNIYNTVLIGSQCWMRENLRTTQYADGTPIAQGNGTSNTTPYWYFPNNDTTNKRTYGLLYNWPATMHEATTSNATPSGVQGICPNGWHVPSDAEWTILIDYVSSQSEYGCSDNSSYIAKALASPMGWHSYSSSCTPGDNPNDNNATGFNALPVGYFYSTYYNLGYSAYFWSSTENSSSYGWYRYLHYSDSYLRRNNSNKRYGYSVRCLYDESMSVVPTVTTSSVTDIASTSATCGGNVTSNGGATVTARGVCWSTSQNPTLSNSHTTDGSGTGSFTSSLTGLTPNTTYYVRAYATNSVGTAYGTQKTFATPCNTVTVSISGSNIINYGQSTTLTASGANSYSWSNNSTSSSITVTPASTTTYTVTGTNSYGCTGTASITVTVNAIAPTVTTNNVSNIGTTSATCGGNVTSNGGATVTARGVCWSTSQNPTLSNSHTTDGSGTGSFTSSLTGLTPNTTYYVRAYATNSAGSAYGTQKTFTTPCNTVTVSISGTNIINYGQSTTLTASGANSYSWSNNSTSSSITVTPASTTTYTVTGTNSYGCTGTASVTVTVNAVVPTVTTNNVSNIGTTSATCGGNVTSNGGATVTARGVCWSTSQNPTLSNSHTTNGSGTGSFTSSLTGLTPNTTYYVRAYATNSAGTAYGAQKTFTTPCNTVTVSISGTNIINYGQSTTLTASGANSYSWSNNSTSSSITVTPASTTTYTVTGSNSYGCTGTAAITVTVNAVVPTVTTNNVSNIGTTSATCGGNVTSGGGASVTARGVCWSTSQNPTISNSHTDDGSGTGSFTSNISGLTPNTTYYVRAYATNSAGTAYGAQKTFTTPCNTVTVSISGSNIINYGQSTTLTASGANSYSWSNNSTSSSITVTPASTTTYTVTGTNSYGCTGTASFTVTVNIVAPTVTTNNVSNIGTTSATCGGNVTSDGGVSVTARGVCWSTSQNPTLSNSHTTDGSGTGSFSSSISGLTPNTTYYVRAYATNSVGTAYGAQKIFTTSCSYPEVTINSESTALCRGESTTLTASGADSYLWSTFATTTSITVSPSSTTSYTVTGTNEYGCTAAYSITVTVYNTYLNISGKTDLCQGESDTLIASSANSYLWSTGETTQSIIVSPSSTTQYSVTSTNAYGCTASTDINISVYGLTISGATNIYEGESTILSAYLSSADVWLKNYISNLSCTHSINMQNGTTYMQEGNVYCFYDSGGPDGDYGMNENYTYTFTSTNGSPVYIWFESCSVGGALSQLFNDEDFLYVYDGSDTLGTRIAYSGSSGSTISNSNSRVYVANSGSLTLKFSSNDDIIYNSWSAIVVSNIENSYQWSTGETTQSITVTPTETTTYTVEGTSLYGCSVTDSITINVLLPSITPSEEGTGNTEIMMECNGGDPITLNANVVIPLFDNYFVYQIPYNPPFSFTEGTRIFTEPRDDMWGEGLDLPFAFNFYGNTYTQVVPGSNSVATFNSDMAGRVCEWSFRETLPSSNLFKNTIFACYRDIYPRANDYNPSTGDGGIFHGVLGSYPYRSYVLSFNNIALFQCSETQTFSSMIVLYEGTNIIDIYLRDVPTCTSWNNGNGVVGIQNSTGTIAAIPPGRNTGPWTTSNEAWRFAPDVYDYTVTWYLGTDTTAATGIVIGEGDVITVTPTESTYYTARLRYTSPGGHQYDLVNYCHVTTNVPNITISGTNIINYGQSTTLTASGADSYSWNTGANTAAITVSPTSTTTYTVTGTNSYGCTGTASVSVTVNAIAPTVTTNNLTSIGTTFATCGGNVTSDGGASVTARGVCWSTSQNPTLSNSHTTDGSGTGNFSSSISGLTPNTTYYVRAYATNSAGTAYGAQKTFTTPCNTVTVSISGSNIINYGQSTTLTASGANSYSWNTGANTAAITVTPASTTTYTVTGTNSYGCTGTASFTVTVNIVAPTVTTNNVSNIGTTFATCGGNVTSTGGASVTARGVCWSTSQNPTLSNSHTTDGSGTGSFTSSLTGLTPNTTYYVRAYATNSAGTAYGTQKTFTTSCSAVTVSINGTSTINYGQSTTLTASGANSYSWNTGANTAAITVTPASTTTYTVTGTDSYGCTGTASVSVTVNAIAPTVTTNNLTSIGTTFATCGGNVTSDGGASVTARGVCWSTSQNPTLSNSHTTDGSGTGSFSSSISGLTPNTTYYVRAYATNSAGTSYGEQKTFTTSNIPQGDGQPCPGAPTLTDRDDNVYNTVQIGTQCWMKENLRTTQYADGTSIAHGSDTSTTTGYWYYPNNNSSNTTTYGLLYNWPAVMHGNSSSNNNPSGVQGVCPTGWHIPSDAEWMQLTDYVSSQSEYICGTNNNYIAKALASTIGWNSNTSTTCAIGETLGSNNSTGFSALPAGSNNGVNYYFFGAYAHFWSSTESSATGAYRRDLTFDAATISRGGMSKYYGSSIRCLSDEDLTHIIVTSSETQTSCGSYVWHGQSYSQSGVYVYSYDLNNYTYVDTLHLTVLSVPTPSILGATSFCQGEYTTLTATGGSSYLWNNGSLQSSISINQSGTYTVTVTNTDGCSASNSVSVSVLPLPTITVSGNTTLCAGGSTTLTASGAVSYQWSTGATSASLNINAFGVYTVTGTSSEGCSNSTSVTVLVSQLPTITISGQTDICSGESTTLTASGGQSYLWSNGATTASISVNEAGIYQVIGYNAAGCSRMAGTEVNVWSPATSEITVISDQTCYTWNSETYCASGDYTQLLQTIHGCDSVVTMHLTVRQSSDTNFYVTLCENELPYHFVNGVIDSTFDENTPADNYDVIFDLTTVNGFDSTVTLHLTIIPSPTPQIISNGYITACQYSTATLFVEDEYVAYQWSNGATTPSIEINTPGFYWVEVIDMNGCIGASEELQMGASNLITQTPAICMVGVENNHNLVIWEEIENPYVQNYQVYRENSQANVYELLATVPASQSNAYEDTSADPSVRAYRYKVTAMDVCFGETPMSELHRTVHLTINRGLNNDWNLIWTHYEGFDFPSYRLYRGSANNDLELIATMPSTLTSFTDHNAPEGALFYQIEVVMNSSCQRHIRDDVAYSGARSNIVYNGEVVHTDTTVTACDHYEWLSGNLTESGNYEHDYTSELGYNIHATLHLTIVPTPNISISGDTSVILGESATLSVESNPQWSYLWSTGETTASITVTPDEQTTYSVTVTNGTCSTEDSITVNIITGVNEYGSSDIKIYPNPTNGIVTIELSTETAAQKPEIQLFDVYGRLLSVVETQNSASLQTVEIDLSRYATGVYLVKVMNDRKVIAVGKIVKE